MMTNGIVGMMWNVIGHIDTYVREGTSITENVQVAFDKFKGTKRQQHPMYIGFCNMKGKHSFCR